MINMHGVIQYHYQHFNLLNTKYKLNSACTIINLTRGRIYQGMSRWAIPAGTSKSYIYWIGRNFVSFTSTRVQAAVWPTLTVFVVRCSGRRQALTEGIWHKFMCELVCLMAPWVTPYNSRKHFVSLRRLAFLQVIHRVGTYFCPVLSHLSIK